MIPKDKKTAINARDAPGARSVVVARSTILAAKEEGATKAKDIKNDISKCRECLLLKPSKPKTYARVTDEKFKKHLEQRGFEQSRIARRVNSPKSKPKQFHP